jgi:DNA-binding CsgD family transcriptional regulator
MYWRRVLHEVLNKNNEFYEFNFTNVGEYQNRKRELSKVQTKKVSRKKMYPLDEVNQGKYLTQRELDCMLGFLNGETITQVADQLNLSPRTVEFYLNNMKRKLKCRTKAELIVKFDQLQLMQKFMQIRG